RAPPFHQGQLQAHRQRLPGQRQLIASSREELIVNHSYAMPQRAQTHVATITTVAAKSPRATQAPTAIARNARSGIATMKTIGTLTIILALLVHGSVAIAADSTSQVIRRDAPKGITTTFYTCIDNAGPDTVALGACLSDEKARQDNRLNATYKALLGKLNPKAKDGLIHAERAWLKFQGTNGEFEASLYGDEIIDNLQLAQNEIFHLCERTNALDKYLAIASDR
ncbi:MAG: lysozyme inhibitor LprI family protein, partial [Rhodanobacter sp.]